MKNFLLLFLLVTNYRIVAQELPTLIIQKKGTGKQTVFSSQHEFRNHQLFALDNNKSFLEEKLMLRKPLHIYSRHITVDSKGKSNSKYLSFILLPGDTLSINEQQNILSSNGFQKPIDSLLLLTEQDYVLTPSTVEEIQQEGLRKFILITEKRYQQRANMIAQMENSLSKPQSLTLSNFNTLLKARAMSQIPFWKLTLNNDEAELLDSCFTSIKTNLAQLSKIESSQLFSIYYSLIKYDVYKRDLLQDDFWNYVFHVSKDLQKKDFYLPYVFVAFENGYKNPKLPYELLVKLDTLKSISPQLNTFKMVMKALDTSLINVELGRSMLNKIANGKYNYFLNSTNARQGKIADLKTALLVDLQDKEVNFKNLVLENSPKLVVLDFWASWCVPCISEYPELMKIKNTYQDDM